MTPPEPKRTKDLLPGDLIYSKHPYGIVWEQVLKPMPRPFPHIVSYWVMNYRLGERTQVTFALCFLEDVTNFRFYRDGELLHAVHSDEELNP